MTLWRTWRELRPRFWIALAAVTALILGATLSFRLQGELVTIGLAAEGPGEALKTRLASDYHSFAAALLWAGGGQGSPITVATVILPALVFGLGGLLAEDRGGTVALTLGLPVPRQRWILMHAILAVVLAAGLAVWQSLLVGLVGVGTTDPIGVGPLAVATATSPAAALPAIGASMLATTVTRDLRNAALVALFLFAAVVFLTQRPYLHASLAPWLPEALLSPTAWSDGPPWRALVPTIIVSVGGVSAAVRRARHLEL